MLSTVILTLYEPFDNLLFETSLHQTHTQRVTLKTNYTFTNQSDISNSHFYILYFQISPNNILLVHLGVTQSLLSFTFLVFSFPPILHHGSWIASVEGLCIIQGFLFTLLHPLSLWTICGLNCDRFYAIAAPLHYSAIVTNRKVSSN